MMAAIQSSTHSVPPRADAPIHRSSVRVSRKPPKRLPKEELEAISRRAQRALIEAQVSPTKEQFAFSEAPSPLLPALQDRFSILRDEEWKQVLDEEPKAKHPSIEYPPKITTLSRYNSSSATSFNSTTSSSSSHSSVTTPTSHSPPGYGKGAFPGYHPSEVGGGPHHDNFSTALEATGHADIALQARLLQMAQNQLYHRAGERGKFEEEGYSGDSEENALGGSPSDLDPIDREQRKEVLSYQRWQEQIVKHQLAQQKLQQFQELQPQTHRLPRRNSKAKRIRPKDISAPLLLSTSCNIPTVPICPEDDSLWRAPKPQTPKSQGEIQRQLRRFKRSLVHSISSRSSEEMEGGEEKGLFSRWMSGKRQWHRQSDYVYASVVEGEPSSLKTPTSPTRDPGFSFRGVGKSASCEALRQHRPMSPPLSPPPSSRSTRLPTSPTENIDRRKARLFRGDSTASNLSNPVSLRRSETQRSTRSERGDGASSEHPKKPVAPPLELKTQPETMDPPSLTPPTSPRGPATMSPAKWGPLRSHDRKPSVVRKTIILTRSPVLPSTSPGTPTSNKQPITKKPSRFSLRQSSLRRIVAGWRHLVMRPDDKTASVGEGVSPNVVSATTEIYGGDGGGRLVVANGGEEGEEEEEEEEEKKKEEVEAWSHAEVAEKEEEMGDVEQQVRVDSLQAREGVEDRVVSCYGASIYDLYQEDEASMDEEEPEHEEEQPPELEEGSFDFEGVEVVELSDGRVVWNTIGPDADPLSGELNFNLLPPHGSLGHDESDPAEEESRAVLTLIENLTRRAQIEMQKQAEGEGDVETSERPPVPMRSPQRLRRGSTSVYYANEFSLHGLLEEMARMQAAMSVDERMDEVMRALESEL
ncbi:uncharacterized protein VTP21DRAFT_4551 [Calcarisporiella thermophila]|uniref:uncharacterized protein n=1 Tax=Calcarisporiella thermophila TaxID=911321 RepID=UPI003743F531